MIASSIADAYSRWRKLPPEERAHWRQIERSLGILSRAGSVSGPGAPRYEPGHWLIRLVKNGPLVPACIVLVHTTVEPGCPENDMGDSRSPFLAAYILGKPAALDDVWWRKGSYVIDEAEYRYRLADAEWARDYAPAEPIAQPRRRVDLKTAPPVYRGKQHQGELNV